MKTTLKQFVSDFNRLQRTVPELKGLRLNRAKEFRIAREVIEGNFL